MVTILSGPSGATGASAYFQPVYSTDGQNLTYVLDSDNKELCSMKYVADVFVNGSYVTRLKLSPNTTSGECSVSVNRVLEDFVSQDLPFGMAGFTASPNSFGLYRVDFGEETDGTVGCTGSSFSVSMGLTGMTASFFNGTLQVAETFDPVDYVVNYPNNQRLFLTRSPRTLGVKDWEEAWLYFLNQPISFFLWPRFARIDAVDALGATSTYYLTTPDNGTVYGQRAVGSGPANINAAAAAGLIIDSLGATALGPIITCDVDTYAFSLNDGSQDWTETFVYDVSCDCERYRPMRLAWLNPLGGFDSYTFRLKTTRSINTTRREYQSFLSKIRADGTFGNSSTDRGRTVYGSTVLESFTAVSEWQSASEHAWLCELFRSPSVYLMREGQPTVPVVVTTNSVEVRDKKGWGNRLLSHTIEFVAANEIVVQRG